MVVNFILFRLFGKFWYNIYLKKLNDDWSSDIRSNFYCKNGKLVKCIVVKCIKEIKNVYLRLCL